MPEASLPNESFSSVPLVRFAQAQNVAAASIAQGHYKESLQIADYVIFEAKQLASNVEPPFRTPRVAPLDSEAVDNHPQSSVLLCPFLVEVDSARPHSQQVKPMLAVTYFNLAVAHHGEAFASSTAAELEYYLSKARACYEFSLELMDEDPDLVGPDDDYIYVYLAVHHNIADLERQLRTGQAEAWKLAVENAFLTVTPDHSFPLYRFFEGVTDPERLQVHVE